MTFVLDPWTNENTYTVATLDMVFGMIGGIQALLWALIMACVGSYQDYYY